MSSAQEIKIVFAGPMGAGKTTAIRSISDSPPVMTEVANTDRESSAKETTTVALDYGQLLLEDGTVVKLYGTPGQERFSFMWDILCRGALGIVLLMDASSPTATQDFELYVAALRRINPDQPFVIGVGRVPSGGDPDFEEYTQRLADRGIVAPVLSVDVRNRDDVLLLVDTLLCMLEARVQETENAAQ